MVVVLEQRVEAMHRGREEKGALQAKPARGMIDAVHDSWLHLRGGDAGLLCNDGGGDRAGRAEGLHEPVVHALVPVE